MYLGNMYKCADNMPNFDAEMQSWDHSIIQVKKIQKDIMHIRQHKLQSKAYLGQHSSHSG